MKITKKIGWQKYEDMIQNQLQSPLLNSIYESLSFIQNELDLEEFTEEELEILEEAENSLGSTYSQQVVPIDPKMMEHVNLSANFDCWLGHTNFNITEDVLTKLEELDGVEVLKVCSRYRFFVGIGRMFDFKEVRKTIENTFIKSKENKIE